MKRTLLACAITVVCCLAIVSTSMAAPDPNNPSLLSYLLEAVEHPVRYTESELALLADAHAYLDAVNAQYDLSLYVPDSEIIKQNDAELFKKAVDITAQDALDSREAEERLYSSAEWLDSTDEAAQLSSFYDVFCAARQTSVDALIALTRYLAFHTPQ